MKGGRGGGGDGRESAVDDGVCAREMNKFAEVWAKVCASHAMCEWEDNRLLGRSAT